MPTPKREAALQQFTEYFVKNYPGPDTVISNPLWHAPKIFNAAFRAIQDAALLSAQAEPREPISEQNARFAIDGAIAYGRMGHNKPPEDDHWLMPYWEIGRHLAAQESAPSITVFLNAAIAFSEAHVASDAMDERDESEEIEALSDAAHSAADLRYNKTKRELVEAYKALQTEPASPTPMQEPISSAPESSDRALPALRAEGEA